MKRKFWLMLFALLSVLALSLGLAGCNFDTPILKDEPKQDDEQKPKHVHSFNVENVCSECGEEWTYTEGLEYYDCNEVDMIQVLQLLPADYPYDLGAGCRLVMGIGTASGDIVIPYGYDGKWVVGFFINDFSDVVRTLTIPDCVIATSMESESLTSVKFGENSQLTSIANGAFRNCRALVSISIPKGVTSIGDEAFRKCSALTNITMPENLASIGEWALADCKSLTTIYIPKDVTSIGLSTFSGCSSLESVSMPEGLTSIDKYAFKDCSSLTGITIPEGVASIGDEAFKNCSLLSSITIPISVTSFGYSVFEGCSSLESIEVMQGNPIYHSSGNCLIKTESKALISGCNTSVIPSDGSVTSIEKYAFANCDSIASVSIPNSVTSIGYGAFQNCTSLSSISIPEGVSSILDYTFYNCNSLEQITIPDSVTSIGTVAFNGCSSLKSISIPGGVTSIGTGAFYNCSSLESIEFQGTVDAWKRIDKDSQWNYLTGDYTVICSDGTITKDGTVTF